MIILDNLDEKDVEILRVIRSTTSQCLTPDSVKMSGENLDLIEVSKKLELLKDQNLVVRVLDPPCYRIHANGENLFWGKGESWSKILHLLYVHSLEQEKLWRITGRAMDEFNSAFNMLIFKGFIHRLDIKKDDKEIHLWELTPAGKKYVVDEFEGKRQEAEIDLRKTILHTEESLRDLVYSVLNREYGITWETDTQRGWSNKVREQLEHRLTDRQKEFPTKNVSKRLIDYCYILDLKSLINKNEMIFKPIFHEWEKIMMFFDELGKHRDPIMHNTNPLSYSETSLVIGICGEFDNIVEHWKKGFSRKIISYLCNLNFDVRESGNEEDDQKEQEQALDLANIWINKIKALSSDKIETNTMAHSEPIVIKLREGIVTTKLANLTRSYNGTYAKTAAIYFETESKDALSKIISIGHHTYWHLEWIIADAIDVHSLISKVEENTGKKPSSTSGTGLAPNVHYDSADYYISNSNGKRIRVTLTSIDSTKSKIGITHDDAMFDKGFTKAHEVFSPDFVLSIVYGEMPLMKVQAMIAEALSLN